MIEVPVLPLSAWGGDPPGREPASADFARALRAGLESTGFVVLEDPGVDAPAIRSAYAALERFFALDAAEKARSGGVAGGQRGYTGYAVEHARDHPVPDLKEFFHVGQEEPARSAFAYPGNRWPAAVPELRPALLRLYRELERCAARVLEALAFAYGIPAGAFSELVAGGNSILRGLHYPPVPDDAPEGAVRAAPHEDINLVTLLCEATDAGLEIRTPEGAWLPIETKPGQIVADSGDMLTQLTGGVIPATTHRVVNPRGAAARASRYSLPFFAHPRPECDLTVLAPFATPERVAHHPPITAGAFLQRRLREIGLTPAAGS
jgi:isopenicillin N synthase-like dioxygenase